MIETVQAETESGYVTLDEITFIQLDFVKLNHQKQISIHLQLQLLVIQVAEVENESNYLYSPLKRTFRSVVRINAYVILACRKFKRKLFLVKHKEVKSLVTVLLPNN